MSDYPQDAGRVAYADTYTPSASRNCRGTTPHASVAGLVLSPGFHGIGPWYKSFVGSGTFHPTADGQRMMAYAVRAALTRLGAQSPAIHGGSGIVTVAGRVGSLRVGRSTLDDIEQFAGPPDEIGDAGTSSGSQPVEALGYACVRAHALAYLAPNVFCHVGFYINIDTGRLVEFATDSSHYAALGTIFVGMKTARAARYAHRPAVGGCSDSIYLHAHGQFGYPLLSLLIADARHGRPRVTKNGSSEIPLIGGHVDGMVLNGGADVFDCA